MLSIPDFFRKLRREMSTAAAGGVGAHCPEQLEQGEDCASGFVHSLGGIVVSPGLVFIR
jgi:hypothetical protein